MNLTAKSLRRRVGHPRRHRRDREPTAVSRGPLKALHDSLRSSRVPATVQTRRRSRDSTQTLRRPVIDARAPPSRRGAAASRRAAASAAPAADDQYAALAQAERPVADAARGEQASFWRRSQSHGRRRAEPAPRLPPAGGRGRARTSQRVAAPPRITAFEARRISRRARNVTFRRIAATRRPRTRRRGVLHPARGRAHAQDDRARRVPRRRGPGRRRVSATCSRAALAAARRAGPKLHWCLEFHCAQRGAGVLLESGLTSGRSPRRQRGPASLGLVFERSHTLGEMDGMLWFGEDADLRDGAAADLGDVAYEECRGRVGISRRPRRHADRPRSRRCRGCLADSLWSRRRRGDDTDRPRSRRRRGCLAD